MSQRALGPQFSGSVSAYGIHVHDKAPDDRRHLLNFDDERDVPVDALHTAQTTVDPKRVAGYARGTRSSRQPMVFHEHQGQMWIENGHHRVAAAVVKGQSTVRGLVYREQQ